jgi:hypothetical protein
MNRWLRLFSPSSRNARLFLVVLLLVGSMVLAFFYWRSRRGALPPDIERGLARTLRVEELKALNRNSDRDDLRDWEEIIFRTDPNNPDTDGDATPDGEEVKQNRDPKKAGPDDLSAAPSPLEAADDPDSENLTSDFTARFLREPITQLLAGAKPDFDSDAVDDYTRRLLSQPVLSAAPTPKPADIKIQPDETPQALTEYFNGFKAGFDLLSRRGKNEIDIVTEVFKSQRYDVLKALETYTLAYERAIKDLKALGVPASLRQFHLQILIYLEKFKYSVELLQKAESDPILAMLAMHERLKLDDEFKTFLKNSQAKIVASFGRAKRITP